MAIALFCYVFFDSVAWLPLLLGECVVFAALYLVYKFYNPGLAVVKGDNRRKVFYTLSAFLCMFMLSALVVVYESQFKVSPFSQYSLGYAIVPVLSSVLCAPIREELFYRHWLISYMRKYNLSGRIILLVSSITFYLPHVSFGLGEWTLANLRLDVLLSGVILYFLYIRTNDYRCCVVAHALSNLFLDVVLYNCFNLSFLRWIQFVS